MINNTIFNIAIAIIFFGLFIIGMVFSGEFELLMLIGIIGLIGFSYFVFRVVTMSKANQS
ncbi:hypothetical protein [Paraliobacillus sp. X-1268]|uniref:hypothetical protein n=1 Tax=Paraliobacillus sp. X-1268 TaxID=2213193 RepID=UPI000E3BF182|nr:hypothetical protein [Paraliobacillus sp. X-1268]